MFLFINQFVSYNVEKIERIFIIILHKISMSSSYQAQREAYRHKLMSELMFRDDEQVDLKRYIRAFVSKSYPKRIFIL